MLVSKPMFNLRTLKRCTTTLNANSARINNRTTEFALYEKTVNLIILFFLLINVIFMKKKKSF